MIGDFGDLGDYAIPEWNRTTFVPYKLKITHLIRTLYCAYTLQWILCIHLAIHELDDISPN